MTTRPLFMMPPSVEPFRPSRTTRGRQYIHRSPGRHLPARRREYGAAEMTVTYLALGGRRVRAAATHTARLAAAGTPVTLITTARPEWDGVRLPPSVTVRVARSAAHARHLIRPGDQVVAGDPEALAATYGRPAHPEPRSGPPRRPGAADLAVVTPWYPGPDDPFAGAFVRAATAAVGPAAGRVAVLHTENWYYPPGRLRGQLLGVRAERQARRCGNATVLDTPEGELTRVVVPVPGGGDHLAYADEQTRALRAALPTGLIEAPVVHAHTGMFGGVVAARLARPDARIVVTEHATFLADFLRRPGGHLRYGRMLARVDALLCVGGGLRDRLAAAFPEHAAKLRIVPNAVDFTRFAVRPEPPREPRRWLYIGRLMAHKGVPVLLDAFARVAAEDPGVALTLVGAGPLEAELDARIAALGLGGRVTRLPAVPPDAVTGLLHRHDLLVHASERETFGMTVVEAVATGTPVLVARSDGPAETLDGIGDRAGALFPPTGDPAVIVAAYRELRERFGALDLAGARRVLLDRYGSEAVGARLRAIYAGDGPPPAAAGTRAGPPPLPSRPAVRRLAGRLPSPVPEALVRTAARVAARVRAAGLRRPSTVGGRR
jgi:glycogen(starch) synthase